MQVYRPRLQIYGVCCEGGGRRWPPGRAPVTRPSSQLRPRPPLGGNWRVYGTHKTMGTPQKYSFKCAFRSLCLLLQSAMILLSVEETK